MSETCVCPCISMQVACTGVRATTGEGSRGRPEGLYLRPVLFLCTAGTKGNRSFQTPSIMLRPNYPIHICNIVLYNTDLRSVRESVPSSTAYETPQQKLYKHQADKDWYRLPPLHIDVQRSSATGGGVECEHFVAYTIRRSGKHPPDR